MLDAVFEVVRRDFQVAVELRLGEGERLSLLGESGAGKTTVLKTLAGLIPMRRGQIELGGRAISTGGRHVVAPERRGVGLVSQTSALFPHLTVLENIAYAPGSRLAPARLLAERLGLSPLLDARPGALSEGERRRVALARSLRAGCRLLCLDEPFSALDRPLGESLLELVLGELRQFPGCAILVTHRLEEAQHFSDRLAVLHRGRLLQIGGAREVVLKPSSPEVARLVGYRGWLRRGGMVLGVHPELAAAEFPGGLALAATVLSCHPQGARFDLEMEAEGEWAGCFHMLGNEAATPGARLNVLLPSSPVFAEREAGSA